MSYDINIVEFRTEDAAMQRASALLSPGPLTLHRFECEPQIKPSEYRLTLPLELHLCQAGLVRGRGRGRGRGLDLHRRPSLLMAERDIHHPPQPVIPQRFVCCGNCWLLGGFSGRPVRTTNR